jgi:polyferredoxin
MWIGLAVLLIATVFVRNVYCRFLCPVGAALGLL